MENGANFREKISFALANFRLNISQMLYQLSPWQKLAVVGFILLALPGYWTARFLTYGGLNLLYKNTYLQAKPSFTESKPIQKNDLPILRFIDGTYGAVVNVTNPNTDISLRSGRVELVGLNSAGIEVHKENQTFFLLPGERKQVIFANFSSLLEINSIKTDLKDLHWQKRFEIPQLELLPNRPTSWQEEYGTLTVKYDGSITNPSPFTLKEVKIKYLVFGKENQILGVDTRTERDLRPNETRSFPMSTRLVSPDEVERIQVTAESNPLDLNNLRFK